MPFWFHKYPGTNFHEQNIDWLMEELKKTANEMKEFEIVNELYYAGAWDITKQYKRYSVVVDSNLGYMSIKDVPSGIQLTNTDYWVQVSDFTPQLANLGSRVSVLEGKVSTLENDISVIKDRMKSLAARKVLWVGDSYGNGWDGSTSIPDPYAKVDSMIGWTGVNISRGGCRFGTTSTPDNYKFLTLLQEYVGSHSDMASFTDVIVIGGANDICHNPTADISGAIDAVCNYIKANFVNAKISIGMVARLINTGSYNTGFSNFENILSQYIKGAALNGADYLAGSELINHDYSLLASDGIHLTSYQEMGIKLAELIISGDFYRDQTLTTSVEPVTTNTADDIAPTTINFQNTLYRGKNIVIDCNDLEFNFSPEKAITWRKAYKFCKVSGSTTTRNLFVAGNKAYRYNGSAVIDYLDSNQVTQHTVQPITIYFYDNWLYLSWDGLIEGGVTLSDCKSIHFRTGFVITLDEALC